MIVRSVGNGVEALGSRARWAVIALVAVMVTDVVAIGSDLLEIDLMNRFLDGENITLDELEADDNRQAAAGFLFLASVIVSAVLFIRWFRRAYGNLPALGASELRFKPGWAIGSWFVPFLNLWRPKQIANDIWRGSDPEAPAEQPSWRERSTPALLSIWWGAWIIASFLGNAAGRLWFRSDTPEHIRDAATVDAVSSVVDILAAVLAILVVRKLTARQEGRAQRLAFAEASDTTPEPA